MNEPTPELSIVIPVFNEAASLPELFRRIGALLDAERLESEIIFIDDGSTDGSAEMLNGYSASDSRVVVLHLSRNFGHQSAVSAGLDWSRGRGVVVMDGDLQDTPETIPRFIEQWKNGADVVYAIRKERKEHAMLLWSYHLFYRLLRSLADVAIPVDSGDFCLMDRRVVDALARLPERCRFVRGMRSWVGFRQVGIEVERDARFAGRSKYTLRGLVRLALDGIVAFSFFPLRLIMWFGLGISAFSVLLGIFYAVKRLTVGLNPPGFASLMVLISFFSGVQMITLGVMSEYLGRVFDEVKRRPNYLVASVRRGVDSSES